MARLFKIRRLQWGRLIFRFLALVGTCAAVWSPFLKAQVSIENVTSVPIQTWVKGAVVREVDIILHTGSYIRYRQHTIDTKGDELRDVIESREGTVARLLMRDNRPLTDDEDKAERSRLTVLIADPSEFAKHAKALANSKKQAIELVKLMPEAMIYTYAGDQTPTPGSTTSQVVLDYVPNPKFNPPTTTSQALTGLRGRVWIDTKSRTIVRIDGEIFQGINFGWGMLAHIYPGGRVGVEQADVLNGRWNFIHFHEQVTAKALMVKTIIVKSDIECLDFTEVPRIATYKDAIDLLLKTPLPK